MKQYMNTRIQVRQTKQRNEIDGWIHKWMDGRSPPRCRRTCSFSAASRFASITAMRSSDAALSALARSSRASSARDTARSALPWISARNLSLSVARLSASCRAVSALIWALSSAPCRSEARCSLVWARAVADSSEDRLCSVAVRPEDLHQVPTCSIGLRCQAMQSNAMQWNAKRYDTIRYDTMRYDAIRTLSGRDATTREWESGSSTLSQGTPHEADISHNFATYSSITVSLHPRSSALRFSTSASCVPERAVASRSLSSMS